MMELLHSVMMLVRCICLLVCMTLGLVILIDEGEAATFTFVNRCGETVWPGVLSNAGTARLGTTGFELPPGASLAVPAPSSWSGRLWARTGCAHDPATGRLVCTTGDCGSGAAECALGGGGAGLDFYDVSLVDGYNLPVLVQPSAGSCASAGCAADLNAMCPPELRSGGGAACRSACDAFGRDEFCCSGAHATPATCGPTSYSQVFKMACPRSYSYAFDDPTSTFTCAGGPDYTVTFCPAGATPSQKSTAVPGATATTPTTVPGTATPTTAPGAAATTPTMVPGTEMPAMMPGMTFTDANPGSTPMPMGGEASIGGSIQGQGVFLGSRRDDSWLANMATGDVTARGAVAAGLAQLVVAPLALLVLHLLQR
ncbi:thaumatin-like protein 1 [Lolium rigidum]|uniref:thaumatin-like protein 1 n=1 Tax=Lolium rigidum TaxID=89674 RepID=UPI001F5D71D2|nr:thaumatin-like protein 1 [Lolium rigidum]